jgi:hypothetical protein
MLDARLLVSAAAVLVVVGRVCACASDTPAAAIIESSMVFFMK